MKCIFLLLFFGLFVFSIVYVQSGCFVNVKKNGLMVVMSFDYLFFEMFDVNNKVVGFDMDLFNVVVKYMGVKVNFVIQSFDGLVFSLLVKKVDLIVVGMIVIEECKKSVLFSVFYISGFNVIVICKDIFGISKFSDFFGKMVVVQFGIVQEKLVGDVKGVSVKFFNFYIDVVMVVQIWQVQVMVLYKVVVNLFVKVYFDFKIVGMFGSLNMLFVMCKDCGDL